MKKKGSSHQDYSFGRYSKIIADAQEKLKEQFELLKIEERRRLVGGNMGIHNYVQSEMVEGYFGIYPDVYLENSLVNE